MAGQGRGGVKTGHNIYNELFLAVLGARPSPAGCTVLVLELLLPWQHESRLYRASLAEKNPVLLHTST